jgi:hypothetical protein
LFYDVDDLDWILVLPEPQHPPSERAQVGIRVTVPGLVSRELGDPPLVVGGWNRGVKGARVPETTIDEHGDVLAAEQHVRPATRQLRKRPVDPVSQPSTMSFPTDNDLGGCVPTSRATHAD